MAGGSTLFSYLSRLLDRFHSAPLQKIVLAALALLVLGVAVSTVLRWLRRRRQDRPDRWPALLTALAGNVLKVLVGLAVLAGLCLHLRFSGEEFTRKRGGTSQRNYEAVKTIWGRPHVQNELYVKLAYYTTHFYDKDGLELDPAKLEAADEPIGFNKVDVEHDIPGNPIRSADHEIRLRPNYRRKGGAWYPGFEAEAAFRYRITNFADRDATAKLYFPLPERQGLVDNLRILVDGQPLPVKVNLECEKLQWKLPMARGESHDLIIAYHSRGLGHIRLRPDSGRKLGSYRVRMACAEIPIERIDYPIGCMTPTAIKPAGEGCVLDWRLDSAVTRLDMGIKVPDRSQPGYYIGRVLEGGAWGMVLLLAMVAVSVLIVRGEPRWIDLAILAFGYHLYYLLMAHLGDWLPGLAPGMLISAAVLSAVVAVYHLLCTPRATAWPAIGFFLLFTVAYPLIRVSEFEGLALTILYVALLAYVVARLVLRRRLR
jgi:hypothetical protein